MKRIQHSIAAGILLLGIGFPAYGCVLKDPQPKKIALTTQYVEEAPKKQYVKVALLLDTSNSMDGLINQAKSQLWDIVNEFAHVRCGNETRPTLEIALYEYGNDNLSVREGYVRQVLSFSSDLDDISEKLFSLTTNGGEEFCGKVINTSLKQLDWGKNQDDLKMIFIAGNEPFTQGKLNYKDAVTDAKEKGIVVNTIFCGSHEQGIKTEWKNGAVLTGGEYMSIDHNREVVYIKTPYDKVIIELNSQLNNTYISYGALGAQKKAMQSTQDANAAELEEAVVVKRAVSKSSRVYKNSTWDMVDAVADDEIELAEIPKEDLPRELQNKSTKEIEAYLEEKKAEREKIQKKIQELNAKREQYIAENNKEEKGELENALLNAIKKQAADKNYSWDK